MTNHLPIRRNAQVALRKAKNLIEVTDRILAGRDTRLAATDDGWIQPHGDAKAVPLEVSNERWVKNVYANGDVTMKDKETGRMWLYDANLCGEMGWDAAVAYCNKLTYAGYSDWRLPDKNELKAQFSQKEFFAGVQDFPAYWAYNSSEDYAWVVIMYNGDLGLAIRANDDGSVWPVRGGQ
jgi:hypothetical protein